MIEKSKRGGLTFVGAKRYARANNKQMETFDPKIESNYITYVDANNLYGWAMVQSLPYKDIKFVPCPTSDAVNPPTLETWSETFLTTIVQTADDAETSYFAEVDLEFPPEIHELLKQFPPCPETLKPDPDWFSDYR